LAGVTGNIGTRLLKKLSSEKERHRLINSFDKSTDILVAWDENQTETEGKTIEAFVQYLISAGKQVQCAVYHHTRKKELIKAFPKDGRLHLSKFDFNTFGLPKTQQLKQLLSKRFDYFINLNIEGRLPLNSIAGLTNATCRIGYPVEKSIPFYDVLIGNPHSDVLVAYIDDLKHYLQKIG
jgi:hypothetical protein